MKGNVELGVDSRHEGTEEIRGSVPDPLEIHLERRSSTERVLISERVIGHDVGDTWASRQNARRRRLRPIPVETEVSRRIVSRSVQSDVPLPQEPIVPLEIEVVVVLERKRSR